MPPSPRTKQKSQSSSSEAPVTLPQIHERTNAAHTHARRYVWMLPLLLVAAWLGLRSLGADALWYDEWWSVYYAGAGAQFGEVSPAVTWMRVAAEFHELNPPGYYIVLNLWSDVMGTVPGVLRGWSLLMGVMALALVYRLATDLHSPTAGLFAAGALATSAFFVTYTHEARAYAQMAALTALTLWAYWRLTYTVRRRPVPYFVLLFAGTAGLLYTHYMAVMVLAALGLWHLFFAPKTRRWWWITLIVVLAGLTFVPWVLRAFEALSQVDSDSTRDFFALPPLEIAARMLNRFSNGSALLVLALAWFALPRARLLLWVTGVALSLALIANAAVGFLTDVHYLIALFPPLAVIAGIGLARLPRGRAVIAPLWAVLGVWLALFPKQPEPLTLTLRRYIPWDDLLAAVEPHSDVTDHMVYLLPAPDPEWMHQPVAEYYAEGSRLFFEAVDSFPNRLPRSFEDKLRREINTHNRMWLAHDTRLSHAPSVYALEMRDWLVQQGEMLDCHADRNVGPNEVQLFALAPEPGGGRALTGGVNVARHSTLPYVSLAGNLAVTLITERTPDVPPDTYSVSVQLSRPGKAAIVAQQDFPLPEEQQACRLVEFPVEELAPGEYTGYIVVYNWATGERLSLADNPETDRIPLFETRIEE